MTTSEAAPAPRTDLDETVGDLADFLGRRRRLFVLTGAGCSTESGIPDYRDAGGRWKVREPMQLGEFVGSAAARRRYWARSLLGYERVRRSVPNAAHRALARLEDMGRVVCLVTQNVDGLHQRAGSRRVVDLHGRLDTVECLDCRTTFSRERIQRELLALNPDWRHLPAAPTPDGDADPGSVDYDSFRVPSCRRCAGALKPFVVFFGENVPKVRVEEAFAHLAESDALLVVGSSLMVWSGYRFVRAAVDRGLDVAAVNLGRTRADGELRIKVERPCGEVLARLVRRLGSTEAPAGGLARPIRPPSTTRVGPT